MKERRLLPGLSRRKGHSWEEDPVRNFLIIVMLIIIGFLIYKAYQGGVFRPSPRQGKTPQEAVHGVVSAGKDVGRNTRKALDKVRIP